MDKLLYIFFTFWILYHIIMSLVHKYLLLIPHIAIGIAALHNDVLCTFTDLAWMYLLVRLKAWAQICSCDAWAQICLPYSCHSCAALCSMALMQLHCCREGRIAKSAVFSQRQTASSWIHIFGSFQLAYFLSVSIVWHWIGMEGVALFLPLATNLQFSAIVS